tara:strand:- start:242 stop:466 length:225 start_codon:yes stop_codon:yes gene_type:complete
MKKADLFKKFEIEKREYPTVIGGITTSMDSDTNSSGERFDVLKSTFDSSGNPTGLDNIITGPSNLDQPTLTIAP